MRTATITAYVAAVKDEALGKPRGDDVSTLLLLMGKSELDLLTDAERMRTALTLERIEVGVQALGEHQNALALGIGHLIGMAGYPKPTFWGRLRAAWRAWQRGS